MPTSDLLAMFRQTFGADATVAAVAPGRVNLIGEHTDYNDGFVFPAAINLELGVAARPTNGPTRLVSAQRGDAPPFDANTVTPGQVAGWASYAAGMAWALRCEGFEDLPNIEAIVASGVPIGTGVSSSAALEMAFGVVWNHLDGLGLTATELAKLGQKCENRFVGLNCGIMDQMASANGRAGNAMFLDTRTLEIQYAPIPADARIVLCDTKKPRALTGSAYNERRSQCEEAARGMGVPALRDATLPMLEAHRGEWSDVVFRRARHVVGENDRCLAFRAALQQGDHRQLGALMHASHESLRDDYEVSCKELDAMAEAGWASPGCIGARMTGAGFGGACVALVQVEKVPDFVESAAQRYTASTGQTGAFTVCEAVDGARIVVP